MITTDINVRFTLDYIIQLCQSLCKLIISLLHTLGTRWADA